MKNEVWKDIKDFENLYQVSSYGRIRTKEIEKKGKNQYCEYCIKTKPKILKPRIDKKGYIHYALYKNGKIKEFKAHRLVAMAFIPNLENKPQINHKDMNKQNNNVENLEWCTNGENQKHSYLNNKNRKNFFKENNPRKK